MNIVLVWFGHSVCTKQYTKNSNAKHVVKVDNDENDITHWLGKTFGILSRLAGKWLWIAFVYDVIGNMGIATNVYTRGNSSHHNRALRRWEMAISFIMICECVRSCKFYLKLSLASDFTLTKCTRTVIVWEVPLLNVTSGNPYATAEVTI